MVSVFISYAHADEELEKRFLVHLGALKRERLIGVWHDRMLRPGEHLDTAIEKELAAADLVILLVSPDFINSDYCTEKEMQRAFARARDGRCRVVPVILKPCLWRDIPIDDRGGRLGDFVALPHDGKPVTRSRHGRESALDSVVAGIRHLIKDKSAPGSVVPARKKDESSPPVDVTHPSVRGDTAEETLADTAARERSLAALERSLFKYSADGWNAARAAHKRLVEELKAKSRMLSRVGCRVEELSDYPYGLMIVGKGVVMTVSCNEPLKLKLKPSISIPGRLPPLRSAPLTVQFYDGIPGRLPGWPRTLKEWEFNFELLGPGRTAWVGPFRDPSMPDAKEHSEDQIGEFLLRHFFDLQKGHLAQS